MRNPVARSSLLSTRTTQPGNCIQIDDDKEVVGEKVSDKNGTG